MSYLIISYNHCIPLSNIISSTSLYPIFFSNDGEYESHLPNIKQPNLVPYMCRFPTKIMVSGEVFNILNIGGCGLLENLMGNIVENTKRLENQ